MKSTTTLGSRVGIELKECARVLAERRGENLSRYVEGALRERVVRDLGRDRKRNRRAAER